MMHRAWTPACMLTLLGAAIAPVPALAGTPDVAPAAQPAGSPGSASYDVGLMLGSQLEHNGLGSNLSVDDLVRGLKDAVSGRAITPEERDAALRFMHDSHDTLAGQNRAKGREFLERNAQQPGVVTLPSGLQYRVLAEGEPGGKPPSPNDQVTVRYRARFIDGSEFDRSDTHGHPATFRVNGVFKAWQEAFRVMKPGAKWELFVPPELGYGNNPPPPIPPGSVLVYDLELLRIEPIPPMDPAALARPKPSAPPMAH